MPIGKRLPSVGTLWTNSTGPAMNVIWALNWRSSTGAGAVWATAAKRQAVAMVKIFILRSLRYKFRNEVGWAVGEAFELCGLLGAVSLILIMSGDSRG